MNKIIFLFCCTLIICTHLSAQITIDQSSYTTTFAGTTDSASIAIGSLPALATGANAIWDLSTINYTVNDTPYIMHNNGPFGYWYADFVRRVITGNLFFNTRPYFNIDSSGYKQFGETIDGRSWGLLGVIAGANAFDSIIFPPQTDVYTSPLIKVNFPATDASNWSSSYTSDVNFTITYSTYYNNAHGIYRSIITEYDTVIGWGKMKVKTALGLPSGYMNVLQVKVNYQQMDSFYVAGSPADPALVSAMGLTQGAISTSYEYRYIRPNEVTPLVDVFFVNSNYSNTNVQKTVVHQQRLDLIDTTLSINSANNSNLDKIQIYPNPVNSNTINIDFQTNNIISYQLVNMLGQNMITGTLSANKGKNFIQLPSTITPGLYYLHLNTDNKEFYTKPVNILR